MEEEEETNRFGGGSHGLHFLVGHPYIARRLREGAGPREAAAAGVVVVVQWEGQAVLKKKSSTTVSQ